MRSHYCGEITSKNLEHEVTICGWIHKRRDHGGVIFLDVRDIKGICQAVINPNNEESFAIAESLRNEYVVQISGIVRERLKGTINKNMPTGEIELESKDILTWAPEHFQISDAPVDGTFDVIVAREKLRDEAYDEYIKERGQVDAIINKMIDEDHEMMRITKMKQEQSKQDMILSVNEKKALLKR